MEFEWDADKAVANEQKHGVSFDEAATASAIPFRSPSPTPITRTARIDFSCSANPSRVGLWWSRTPKGKTAFASPALDWPPDLSDTHMKKMSEDDDMRPEYDFSDGVRGKYAERFAQGSNVVVLDPDVAAAFKTRQAVNDALREQIRKRAGDQEAG